MLIGNKRIHKETEIHYHHCRLEHIKDALSNTNAMPSIYCDNNGIGYRGYAIEKTTDQDGNPVNITWFYHWDEEGDIIDYIKNEYQGGFHV